jgi:uncharacterized protein (TIGR00725 family)
VKKIAAVVGDTRIDPTSDQAAVVRSTARAAILSGLRIQTGGLGDLPVIVAESARATPGYESGDLIALVPGFDPADGCADIVIATGLDLVRNALVANADVVIAIGGGAGTLSEIALAWQLNRPILGWTGEGWSARLAGTAVDHRRQDVVIPFASEDDIRELLATCMHDSPRRHQGMG